MIRKMLQKLAFASTLSLCARAHAGESLAARSAVQEGNTALAAGRYDEALAAYKRAEVDMPDAAEITYNRGIALFRKGDTDAARSAFSDALRTRDPRLEARAKFNLGNCAYGVALQRENDLPAAIEELQKAISHWRDALALEPGDTAARQNIETAQLLLKDLLDKEKKRQEEERKKQEEEEKKKNPESQPTSQPEEPEKKEDSPQKKPDQPQDPQQPQPDQKKPDQKPKDEKKEQQAGQKPQKKKSEPSMEDAQRKLQAIRDKERARRDDRKQREALLGGAAPVERDW